MAVQSFSTVLPEDFENERDRLGKLLQAVAGGLALPPAKEIVISYAGATNNISTVVYKDAADGAVVATLTLTYAGGAVANDDLVTKVTRS